LSGVDIVREDDIKDGPMIPTDSSGHAHYEPGSWGRGIGDCLLKQPTFGSRSLQIAHELLGAEGCYLYFDKVNGNWIQSGNEVGTCNDPKGIEDHHKEHKRKAELNSNESKLYTEYPAKASARVQMARSRNVHPHPWKAYFEDLLVFCGLGFIHWNLWRNTLLVIVMSGFCCQRCEGGVYLG
jgi:hypothetical protein